MSAKKESFLILLVYNLVSIAVLSLKLLFSGFYTTRFQIFLFLDICKFFMFSSHIITLLTVLISHISVAKNTIEHIKILKDIDYRFKGLDTSFLKKLIDFFNFVFTCHFYFVVSVV